MWTFVHRAGKLKLVNRVVRNKSCCGKETLELKIGEPLPPHICLNKRNESRELKDGRNHYHRNTMDNCRCGGINPSCDKCGGTGRLNN